MHRVIQDRLEQALAGTDDVPVTEHLAQCAECREEVADMRRHSAMLRSLRAPQSDLTPRPGFYARVMERIEAQRPISIWQLFFDSRFARRMAFASMAMAFLFSVYLVSSEHFAQPTHFEQPTTVAVDLAGEPQVMISSAGLPDKDTVLVNLVTYRAQ
jgi:anti-sigma factor RsiW